MRIRFRRDCWYRCGSVLCRLRSCGRRLRVSRHSPAKTQYSTRNQCLKCFRTIRTLGTYITSLRKRFAVTGVTGGGLLPRPTLLAGRVRSLIECGYPPLEEIGPRCPICGVGELSDFPGSHGVFGNPNPRGIESRQCTYCGICFPFNSLKRKETLDTRKKLE